MKAVGRCHQPIPCRKTGIRGPGGSAMVERYPGRVVDSVILVTRGRARGGQPARGRSVVAMAQAVPALIEFPADEPERALRFWGGLLGVPLEPRGEREGVGWESRSTVPAIG